LLHEDVTPEKAEQLRKQEKEQEQARQRKKKLFY